MKIIIAILLVLQANISFGQKQFVPTHFNTSADEDAMSVTEIPENKYFFVAKQNGTTDKNVGDLFCFITDKDGNVIKSKTLIKESDTAAFFPNGVFFNDNGSLSITAVVFDQSKYIYTSIIIVNVDTNFNILFSKTHPISRYFWNNRQ